MTTYPHAFAGLTAVELSYLDDNFNFIPFAGPVTPIASAVTTDIGTVGPAQVGVTGTATILSFGAGASSENPPVYFVTFTGVLTLINNSTSLILPGGVNIVTAAGDALLAQYLGTGNWRVLAYFCANGRILADQAITTFTSATTVDLGTTIAKVAQIVGNSVISSFGAAASVGWTYDVFFPEGSELVYNSTSMILPDAQNLTLTENQGVRVISLGSGNWRVFPYGGAGSTGPINLSNLMDTQFGSTWGDILFRGATGWQTLAPGVAGAVLSGGTIITDVAAGDGISVLTDDGTATVNNIGVLALAAGANTTLSAATGTVTVSASGGVSAVTAGTGMSVTTASGTATVTNAGVTSLVAGTNVVVSAGTGTVTISAPSLAGVTSVAAGTGISVATTSGTATVTNAGLLSAVAGAGMSVSTASGTATVTNAGVTALVAGANTTISAATGTVTISSTGGGSSGVTSVAAGTGISVATTSGTATVTNAGILSVGAGTGISVIAISGTAAVINSGVVALVAGTGTSVSAATGTVTISATGGSSAFTTVKQYGATGNGTTDDTSFIQAALSSGASDIYFPSGTYLVSSKMLIPSNIRLYADGTSASIKVSASFVIDPGNYPAHAGDAVFINSNFVSGSNTGIIVEGLQIDCTAAGTVGKGLVFYNCTNVHVDKCTFLYGQDGTSFIRSNDFTVTNSYAFGVANCAFDNWDGCTNGIIAHNTIDGNHVSTNYGILFTGVNTDGDQNRTIQGMIANGNNIQNCYVGLWFQAGNGTMTACMTKNCRAIGNVFLDCVYGTAASYGTGNTISNNTYDGCGTSGTGGAISFTTEYSTTSQTGSVVSANIIRNHGNPSGACIYLGAAASENNIVGNTIIGGNYAYAIQMDSNTSTNLVSDTRAIAGSSGTYLNSGSGNIVFDPFSGVGSGTISQVIAGTGLSGGGTSGTVTLTNAGVTSLAAGANTTLSATTGAVTISTSGGGSSGVTSVAAGTGISVATTSGTATVTNAGLLSAVAGAGMSVSTASGTATVTNAGVTALVAGANTTISAATGTVTISSTGGGSSGVTSVAAGTGISVATTSGTATVTNAGVTSLAAGSNMTISAATGTVTLSTAGVTSATVVSALNGGYTLTGAGASIVIPNTGSFNGGALSIGGTANIAISGGWGFFGTSSGNMFLNPATGIVDFWSSTYTAGTPTATGSMRVHIGGVAYDVLVAAV